MSPRQCGVPWGVCHSCPGVGLVLEAGFDGPACRCPECGLEYPMADWIGPCRAAASVLLTDVDGVEAPVCASHAESPRVAGWKRRRLEVAP